MNNYTVDSSSRAFFSGCVGILSSLIALKLLLETSLGSAMVFLIVSALLIVVTVVAFLILEHGGVKGVSIPFADRIGMAGAFLLFVFLFCGFIQSDDGYSGADVSGFWWHQHSVMVVLAFTITIGIVLFLMIHFLRVKELPWFAWLFYYFVMSIPYAMSAVYLNIFSGDLYHIDAYFHPLYSVYYLEPYSETTYSIYGHYELFYLPFLKLLGTRPRVISTLLFCTCMLVLLLTMYVIHQLVENFWIRLIAPMVLCVPTGCLFRSTSYQTTPHRLLFGVLLLAYAVWLRKKSYRMRQVVWGYVICSLAVLWNTESGIICALSWTVWFVLQELRTKGIRFGVILRGAICGVIGVIASVIGALTVVNLYNFVVGGSLFIRPFFYPFLNQSFLNHYEIPLLFRNYPYIYVMILGCACVCYGLHRAYRQSMESNAAVIALCGTLMLGLEAYYATRAAYYALLIVTPFLIIAVCYFANCCIQHQSSGTIYAGIKRVLGIVGATVLAGGLAISVGLWGNLRQLYWEGKYSSMNINDELAWIREHIPEDTYAVGWGVDEVYGYLGWDTGYHMLGTTDVVCDIEANATTYAALLDEIQQHDQVVLSMYMYNGAILQHNLVDINYSMTDEIGVASYRYGLFERSGYQKPYSYEKGNLQEMTCDHQVDFISLGDKYLSVSGWIASDDPVQVGLQNPVTGEIVVLDTNSVTRPDYPGFYGKASYGDYEDTLRQEVVLILDSKEGIIHTERFINEESE